MLANAVKKELAKSYSSGVSLLKIVHHLDLTENTLLMQDISKWQAIEKCTV